MTERLAVCSRLLFMSAAGRPAGRYLGFLRFEWFPFKLSEELNFHVMGAEPNVIVIFVLFWGFFFFLFLSRILAPLLWPAHNVICFLCSRAGCPAPRHRARHNT